MSKAIIVGAGVSGIATALRLRAKGYDVHVFEASSAPGGKMKEISSNGYRFDTGPSLFTMPDLVDELFKLHNEDPRKYYKYKTLTTSCHYFFEDGSSFECPSNVEELDRLLSEKHGETPGAVIKYLAKSGKMYEITSPVFLENSLHKFSTYFSSKGLKGIANLWRLNMFSSMNAVNKKTFKNPKTVQLFNRYATYNGSNPFVAPATLNIIPHLEYGIGTYFPEGGMIDVTNSLYQLAIDKGIGFIFNSKVESIITKDGKAVGIRTNSGTYYSDLVVSNMDVYHTYDKLIKQVEAPKKVSTNEASSSALIFYWGVKKSFKQLGLHNIFFSSDYEKEFRDIFNHKRVSEDPTVYINITSKYKKDDAPDGCENWFVMVNVPSNSGQNWAQLSAEVKANVLRKLSRHFGEDIQALIETEDILDPIKIENNTSSYKGALYGSSSNSKLSAFFRHANFSDKVKNLYFCGGSVHPGGGIPLCLRSAEIVSKLVS